VVIIRYYKVIVLQILFLIIFASCSSISPEEAQEIQEMAEGQEVLLIDVREPSEFAEGHIPGAINVPLDRLVDEIGSIAHGFNQEILIICRSGARSRGATGVLETMGYTNLTDVGGILDWTGEIVMPQ